MVAAAFRIKPTVVEAYSDLFFNVLGRKEDLAYVRSIMGGGKADLLFSGAAMPADDEILLSAGFEGTLVDVLRFAGLTQDEDLSVDDLKKRLIRNGLKTAVKWSGSDGPVFPR